MRPVSLSGIKPPLWAVKLHIILQVQWITRSNFQHDSSALASGWFTLENHIAALTQLALTLFESRLRTFAAIASEPRLFSSSWLSTPRFKATHDKVVKYPPRQGVTSGPSCPLVLSHLYISMPCRY